MNGAHWRDSDAHLDASMDRPNSKHYSSANGDAGKPQPERLHGLQALLHGRYNTEVEGKPCSFTPHVMSPPQAGAVSSISAPPENYAFHLEAAAQKHRYPLPKLVVLGILAGAYIGLGYSLCCLVGGQLSPEIKTDNPGYFSLIFGIYGFPMGLTLCVVAGADLFTSNCMYTTIAVAEGRYGVLGLLRCLLTSYFCNLLGALLLVGVMVGADAFHGSREDFVIELALKKVHQPFGTILCKGILCNWLVCLAVWQGNMARDLTGKFVGIFLPNSAFVSMGFEHCIANMYLVPLSMALGSGISVGTFITKNLLPATLGNIIGGSCFVGMAYACSFGTPAHAIADMWEATLTAGKSCLGGNRLSLPANGRTSSNGQHHMQHADSFAHVGSAAPPGPYPSN